MSVTMKDIALRAGVSRSAVSAVINGTTASRVSAEKRKRILDICREVNYRRNFAATALKERKTGLLGFISNKNKNNKGKDKRYIAKKYNNFLLLVNKQVTFRKIKFCKIITNT